MMTVYPVRVTHKGEDVNICLKLDVKHIRSLQQEHGKSILDMITDAPTDLAMMGTILEAAMRYKHNNNPADLDGDDLFDLLVEQGKGGMVYWLELATGIAVVSGIMTKEQAATMVEAVRSRMDQSMQKVKDADPSVMAAGEKKTILPA